jgi:hypothetical protein
MYYEDNQYVLELHDRFHKKTYTLEIAFTQDEYSNLVKTVTKDTKKAVTEFAKDAIMEKMRTSRTAPNHEEDWKLFVS